MDTIRPVDRSPTSALPTVDLEHPAFPTCPADETPDALLEAAQAATRRQQVAAARRGTYPTPPKLRGPQHG